jgi:Zn-dependent protease with chaperone function
VRIVIYVPFAAALMVTLLATVVSRRLPPRIATWWLAVAGVAAAASSSAALALLAFTAVGQLAPVAAEGHWSVPALRAHDPVLTPVGLGALMILLAAAAALCITAWRRLGALAAARRLCRSVRPESELLVLDDPSPHAFAVPGAARRVVVSSGMLRSLDGAERRALLAHERSHLRHRHHLFLTALRLAAAVNPLLHPVFRAAMFTIERWADEDAAEAVQDRPLVARTLGKAALASLQPPAAALALAVQHVPRRMQAMLAAPPPRRTIVILALGTALLLITGLSLLEAAHDTERLFEAAMHSYRAMHGQ